MKPFLLAEVVSYSFPIKNAPIETNSTEEFLA
jgi:hypothetical protein